VTGAPTCERSVGRVAARLVFRSSAAFVPDDQPS
jgi:hypothetical protein